MRVAPLAAVLLFPLALACAPALAADAAEIAFWESVRDSRDASELRAYLERYPNGDFAVLARRRLTALQSGAQPAPAPAAPAAAPRPAVVARTPQTGDTWTYRLTMPGQPLRTYEVKVGAIAEGKIVDQLSIDGGSPVETAMPGGTYLLPQGVSIFSPYFPARARGRLTRPEILDQPCKTSYFCEASARVIGEEVLALPVGKLNTVKVVVEQTWRASGAGGGSWQVGRMSGGRTLTVWYAPSLGRAVKYHSRITVGDIPPIEPNFDLELVSYQVK
jgi:hypothetical protein